MHEYIHVLAYRSQGATATSYAANLKKFYFAALADGFVVDAREFRIVALAPFVTISTLLLLLIGLAGGEWGMAAFGTLCAHTTMCSGDFGLLSYFAYYRDRGVVTYDDVANKVTHFYGIGKRTKQG